MKHEQLFQIEKFTELFTDARFVALMMYLRKQRPRAFQKEPHGMIQDSGRIDAYLDLLDKIEEAKIPPNKTPIVQPAPNYSNPAPIWSPATPPLQQPS